MSAILRVAQSFLGLAAIACFGAAMHYMHKAGCAGSLKVGTGDINLALSLEGQASSWGFASAILIALLAASFRGRSTLARVGIAVGVGVLGCLVFVAASVQVGSEAIRCP